MVNHHTELIMGWYKNREGRVEVGLINVDRIISGWWWRGEKSWGAEDSDLFV